jgi:cysteine-rich repeat protein
MSFFSRSLFSAYFAALVLFPTPAVAVQSCTLTFQMTSSADEMGTILWSTGYSSASGEFPGNGGSVACVTTIAGALDGFDDNETNRTLTSGVTSLDGFTGPIDLAECSFAAPTVPAVEDFTIEIIDAATTIGDPVFDATVVISSIDCEDVASVCANGLTEGDEDCDDGNFTTGDCCSAACVAEAAEMTCASDGDLCTRDACDGLGSCVHSAVPRLDASCLLATKTKFQIADSVNATADKLAWQWSAGAAFNQSVLGDPADVGYALCVYDQENPTVSLAASVKVEPSVDLWTDDDPKGLGYKDKIGTSDGVTKVQIRTGDEGRTKVKFSARGISLQLPGPAGSSYFAQQPSVIVQLVNDLGTCWSSTFVISNNKVNDADSFKAQTK